MERACLIVAFLCLLGTNLAFQIPPYTFQRTTALAQIFLKEDSKQSAFAGSNNTDFSVTIPSANPSLLHSVHIRSILTDNEVSDCLSIARTHAADTLSWTQPNWRHASYATVDFAVDDCEPLRTYLDDISFQDRIFDLLNDLYEIPKDGMSFLDLFCANYQAKNQTATGGQLQNNVNTTTTMDRLKAHRDGSLLSFVMLLNDPINFIGGGTFFDALRDEPPQEPYLCDGIVRPTRAGDVSLHAGKLLHGASVVTQGERTVLVGFVEVADCYTRPGALSSACREWGRMDVALKRYERQQTMTQGGLAKGWFMNHSRYLPKPTKETGQCAIRGFSPAFSSVERRAAPEFQRRKKLEAEDMLLSTIIVPDRGSEFRELFNGDITVL
jgi:hypothetical protein